jgi:hypothetical protein
VLQFNCPIEKSEVPPRYQYELNPKAVRVSGFQNVVSRQQLRAAQSDNCTVEFTPPRPASYRSEATGRGDGDGDGDGGGDSGGRG